MSSTKQICHVLHDSIATSLQSTVLGASTGDTNWWGYSLPYLEMQPVQLVILLWQQKFTRIQRWGTDWWQNMYQVRVKRGLVVDADSQTQMEGNDSWTDPCGLLSMEQETSLWLSSWWSRQQFAQTESTRNFEMEQLWGQILVYQSI